MQKFNQLSKTNKMAAIPKMILSRVMRDMWYMIYFQKIAT